LIVNVYDSEELAIQAKQKYESHAYAKINWYIKKEIIHSDTQYIAFEEKIPKLCCLSVMQVKLATLETTLIADPYGEKYAEQFSLPIDPLAHKCTVVATLFDNQLLEARVQVFILLEGSKYENHMDHVVYTLDTMLHTLGIRRFDLFSTLSPVFKEKIWPKMKLIKQDGDKTYYYCTLD